MIAITNCLRDSRVIVRDAAAECLLKLHSADYIMAWGPSNRFMETFWKISSQVIFTLAKQLLDTRERDDGLKKLLDLLARLLTLRNDFLKLHQVRKNRCLVRIKALMIYIGYRNARI